MKRQHGAERPELRSRNTAEAEAGVGYLRMETKVYTVGCEARHYIVQWRLRDENKYVFLSHAQS